MRYLYTLFIAAAYTWGVATQAHGHGFTISQLGNQIMAATNDVPVIHSDMFHHDITQVGPNDYTINHGFFQKNASPTLPNVAFGGSDTFSFSMVGPLLYSDGFSVAPAAGVTLEATHTSPNQYASITGASVGITPGFSTPATSSHYVQWVLSGGAVPKGAYGVKYRIEGLDNGNPLTPFDFEEVLVVFDTQGANWGVGPLGSLIDAQELLYQFAMVQANLSTAAPEPASFLLVLGGALGLQRWRKKRTLTIC